MNEITGGFSNEIDVNAAQNTLANLTANLVKVVHGTHDGQHPLANQTVATARATFSVPYNIPTEAAAFVGGEPVDEDYVLRPNDSLEFIKAAGVKG
jgi:hypothetical protein